MNLLIVKPLGHFSNQMKRELLVQLVQQVAGKMYDRKNQKKRKGGDRNVCTVSSNTGIKDIRSYFKHTSIVKSAPFKRSDKDTIVID